MNLLSRFSLAKRSLTLLAAGALLTALLALGITSRELLSGIRIQAINVEVQTQSGVPLTIGSVVVTPSDPKQPVFSYEVINSGDKPISAYAIRHDVTVDSVQTSGVTFTSMWSYNSLLYPQARNPENSGSTAYGAAVNKVVLSVDFVEFADGSTWGADTFKMSEKLAGQRAGGRAALTELRDKSKKHGLKAVSDAIDEEIVLTPESDKSRIWKVGFEEGVRIVRVRLQHAKRKGGSSALESELLKPFDISEERQRQ